MGTRERRLHAADQAAEVYGVDCNIRARQLGLSRADLVGVKCLLLLGHSTRGTELCSFIHRAGGRVREILCVNA